MRCDEMDAAAAQHVEREWKLTAILLGDDLSLLPDLTYLMHYSSFALLVTSGLTPQAARWGTRCDDPCCADVPLS